ncbi:Cinnamate beta-D-glucosyltransferase [Acorus calamus]|uniref:Glycosyltransferase n=1 Tax=Acorus calamus TaxID=4465 RepID=A0AAV9CRP6_ACOCL|nr:Cinnamate beta-D-glucosyltransferase [Acorus calamus]
MGSQPQPLHVLIVSFAGQGHINPLLRLAKRIASKGLLVTFTSTQDIGRRIQTSITQSPDQDVGEPIPVGLGHIRFQFFDDGWDSSDPRRPDLLQYMPHLETVGPPALTDLIKNQAEMGRPVSCVINNPFMPWGIDVSDALKIPSAILWIQSCIVFSTYYHYHHSLCDFPTVDHPDREVTLPGLPSMSADDIPTFLLPTDPYTMLKDAILAQFKNLAKAEWVLMNTFEELEKEAIQAMAKVEKVVTVGPLIDMVEEGEERARVRGDLWKAAAECTEWLDAREARSVVYVSVGSVAVLGKEEMEEMARGLRGSGKPFLWVVRESNMGLLPEGFVEEAAEQGMVVNWSQQDQVLAHPSTGCFLTHCGWNSTLETLAYGVPVIAFPQFGDQYPDAKFLVDVYKVGVRLWRGKNGLIRRDDVEGCVREVVEGPKAEEIRENALKWKEIAGKAVASGGSSDKNLEAFIDGIQGFGGSGLTVGKGA